MRATTPSLKASVRRTVAAAAAVMLGLSLAATAAPAAAVTTAEPITVIVQAVDASGAAVGGIEAVSFTDDGDGVFDPGLGGFPQQGIEVDTPAGSCTTDVFTGSCELHIDAGPAGSIDDCLIWVLEGPRLLDDTDEDATLVVGNEAHAGDTVTAHLQVTATT